MQIAFLMQNNIGAKTLAPASGEMATGKAEKTILKLVWSYQLKYCSNIRRSRPPHESSVQVTTMALH